MGMGVVSATVSLGEVIIYVQRQFCKPRVGGVVKVAQTQFWDKVHRYVVSGK